MALLLREAIGAGLRRARTARRRTLRDVSRAPGSASATCRRSSAAARNRPASCWPPSARRSTSRCRTCSPRPRTRSRGRRSSPRSSPRRACRSVCARPTCGSPERTPRCWALHPRRCLSPRAVRWRAPPPDSPAPAVAAPHARLPRRRRVSVPSGESSCRDHRVRPLGAAARPRLPVASIGRACRDPTARRRAGRVSKYPLRDAPEGSRRRSPISSPVGGSPLRPVPRWGEASAPAALPGGGRCRTRR